MSTTFKSHKEKRNFGLNMRVPSERKVRWGRASVPWHSSEAWCARAAGIRNAIKLRHETNLKKKSLRATVEKKSADRFENERKHREKIALRHEKNKRFFARVERRIKHHVDRAING